MLGKIQANVIKASRLLLQHCNQTHDESDEEEGAIRTASAHKHAFCLAGKCKFIMYLVTKLLNNIWDHLNTNYLNISDAEWMSGQVFGSYSSLFWPALNVCFCVSVCVCVGWWWGLWFWVFVIDLGYLWPWKTWQSLWELTAVTSQEQKDSSLQTAFQLFCHIKYSYVTEFPQSSDLFIIHFNCQAVTLTVLK